MLFDVNAQRKTATVMVVNVVVKCCHRSTREQLLKQLLVQPFFVRHPILCIFPSCCMCACSVPIIPHVLHLRKNWMEMSTYNKVNKNRIMQKWNLFSVHRSRWSELKLIEHC